MIAVDTNILVYAHRRESVFHQAAKDSMESLAQGRQAWGIPAPCLSEFLAVVTNPKVFNPHSTYNQVIAQVDAWLESPHLSILHSTPNHWRVLTELSKKARLQGGQYHDARVAAVCIENGVTQLWTADRDFGRFQALNTLNPLVH